jgi:hypothetical protein
VDITPDPADTSDDLKATITTAAVDPDGDPVSYTFAWYKNNTLTAEVSDTVHAVDTSRGDTWRVVATANDPYASGGTAQDSVVIGNSAPAIAQVDITPDPATSADDLTCVPTGATDPDGDTVGFTYEWTVNAAVVGAGNRLRNGYISGDVVVCTVTPTDGSLTGTPVASRPRR